MEDNRNQMMLLNSYGDITIEWDDEDATAMEKRIAQLLEEGHQFFIVKKAFGFEIPFTKKKLEKVSKLNANRVVVKDDFVTSLFENVPSVKLIDPEGKAKDGEFDVVKGSKDPKEIAKSRSVCCKKATKG